mmetsp:Transcript_53382/g.139119  ORF Transcript_53382/g.139119 Transcript_53382/m.139119 type:complete len:228 (+) Transcript_53382:1364-2047(+)
MITASDASMATAPPIRTTLRTRGGPPQGDVCSCLLAPVVLSPPPEPPAESLVAVPAGGVVAAPQLCGGVEVAVVETGGVVVGGVVTTAGVVPTSDRAAREWWCVRSAARAIPPSARNASIRQRLGWPPSLEAQPPLLLLEFSSSKRFSTLVMALVRLSRRLWPASSACSRSMLTRNWKISLSSLSKPPDLLTLSHIKASSFVLLHFAFVVFTSSTLCSLLLPVSAYL